MKREVPPIIENRRLQSPAPSPQALAFHGRELWLSSRDGRRIFRMNAQTWEVLEEITPPGIVWAAVSTGDALRFTIGEGAEDDRYVYQFVPGSGFSDEGRFACPEFAGSYLSYDAGHVYLSQWYKRRILQLDDGGNILRAIDVGAEISGQTFVDGRIYVLRGTEADGESWHIARLDPREETPQVEDLARVPFQCRSLAFDGNQFWSNHRQANQTVAYSLPDGISICR